MGRTALLVVVAMTALELCGVFVVYVLWRLL
jgi:hypothetical protein